MSRFEVELPKEKVSAIRPVAERIADTIHREISPGLMLSPEDEVSILLASAYGRARDAGFHREKLHALTQQIFELLDATRGPWPVRKRG